MIWIRADANSEIGSGHLMRCLSVADRVREQGSEVCFLLADESSVSVLEQRNMPYRVLGSDYRQMEEELPVLLPLLDSEKNPVLLVDSYFVTAGYLNTLKDHAYVVYMDDKNSFPYPVNAVINYNIYGDLLPYGGEGWAPGTEFLLGTRYVPLRREFTEGGRKVQSRHEVREVLITTGGSDKYLLSRRFLEAFLRDEELQNLHYHVVCGAYHPDVEGMKQYCARFPRVTLYHNVQHMSGLMKQCDVAVTATGSTMYELSALGIPLCCFSFVDNQERILDTFVQKGLVIYGGNYLTLGERLFAETVEQLKGFLRNSDLYREHSARLTGLVDGRGAARIARFLCEKEV